MQNLSLAGTAGAPYSRAELFDAVAYGVDPRAMCWLQERFEVVGRPRESLASPLRRGDILLRRGDGELAHACVIVDPQLRSALDVTLAGGTVEIGGSGNFVFVAERGARPHDEYERFARRVTDSTGRVLNRQVVLRPLEGEGFGENFGERVDPVSLMVGMTIANMNTRPPVTRIEVAAPAPAPAVKWDDGESAATDTYLEAEPKKTKRIAKPKESGWPAFTSRVAETADLSGESFGEGVDENWAEFNSPEHFKLGAGIQHLVDRWAVGGLVSGGCFVADTDASGQVLPLAQWKIFVPDRSKPLQPYGDGKQMAGARWHWIAPNPHVDGSGKTWTATSLAAALQNGSAITLSVGDIIMMSGDLIGEFSDYFSAASGSWRSNPVNIALGLKIGDPFAACVVRRLQFARTGMGAAQDVQMIARAASQRQLMVAEVASTDPTWTMVRALVDFLGKVRGGRGYREMLVISRLQRTKKVTLENIQRVAPWINSAHTAPLIGAAIRASSGFGAKSGIDTDVFQMLVTNGHYAELAMQNQKHFSPDNWAVFEKAHREALTMVDKHVTNSTAPHEHGPIPANAIAQLAHGMHYLTDAFAAGHMRTPRKKMGRSGGLLAIVMHDLENEMGLLVTNGFGHLWRAFGDGSLESPEAAQTDLLRKQYFASKARGKAIDVRFEANRDHVLNAVQAAMKQLHYQAQKHFGDAKNAPKYQENMRIVRGVSMGLLYDDPHRDAAPGDGPGRDSWLAMSLEDKIKFMKKHQPIVLPYTKDWTKGTGNHPPLAYVNTLGTVELDRTKSYDLDQHLAHSDRVLYQLDLDGAGDFSQDITRYTVLAALTPDYVKPWAGESEVWLLKALSRWGDKRGIRDWILRRYAGLTGLGLP